MAGEKNCREHKMNLTNLKDKSVINSNTMKKILILAFLFINVLCVCGQSISDTIEVKQALGPVFFQHGKRLKPRELLEITRYNTESYKEMKIAKSNNDISSVFGFAGGFLIGWPLGTALAGGDPNWTLAAIGAGCVAIAIPLSIAGSKHAKKAVEIYNNGLKQTGQTHVDFNLGLTGSGLYIRMNL
jgi:hypothetical protein